VNIVVLTGTKEVREDIIANRLVPQYFKMCITSYEICLIEKSTFKKFSFERFDSFANRAPLHLLWTLDHRHPLQNSLEEPFALLNFIYLNCVDLDSFLHKDETGTEEEELVIEYVLFYPGLCLPR
jgi:SWI/SNF-related matrix-associated actin-dependent regulator of chromatin subfamily A member 5